MAQTPAFLQLMRVADKNKTFGAVVQKAELLEQIKDAMRAKDKGRLSILRQVNQAVKQIEVDERREVSEADLTAAIRKLQKVTSEELESLNKNGAAAHAERIELLQHQASVLESLLPKQLAGAELEALVGKTIAELGATTKRDMGKVMSALGEATQGNFDKKSAAQMVQNKLS